MVEHNKVEVVAFFRSRNTALGQRVFFSFLLSYRCGAGGPAGSVVQTVCTGRAPPLPFPAS